MKTIGKNGLAAVSAALAAALMLCSCSYGADPGGSSQGIEHGQTLSLDAGMQKIEENDTLILSVDKATAAVRVENKRTGALWYTNPPNIDEDPIAENSARFRMQAQLEITAFDQNGQKKSYDSYTNCINKDQVTYEKVENGLQVIYTFGAKKKVDAGIPKQISEERFNQLFLNSGKLTDEEKTELKQRFRYDEQEKVYYWKTTSSELLLNRLAELFDKAGYTDEDYRIDSTAGKDEAEEGETDMSVQIPVVYALDGESLVVSVPLKTIDMPEGWYLTELSLLPFFGAAIQSEEGYLFVPDGSGALIDFGEPARTTESLYLPLYGPDASLDIQKLAERAEQAVLPVYGLKKGNESFLAVIEDGDAMGVIRGDRAGYLNAFYNVYSSYNLTGRSYIRLGDGSSESQVAAYQRRMYDGDIRVRFLFQEGEKADYAGMAEAYRNYLQERRGVEPAAFEEDLPFIMETVGSIVRNKSILGFSYVGDFAMTTFRQNEEMIGRMREMGVDNLHVRLTGWMNGGLDQSIAETIKPLSVLGGNGGFKKLLAYAGEEGVTIYPDVHFLTANKGHGFSTYWDAAKTIDRRIARQYLYDVETAESLEGDELTYRSQRYVVKPSAVAKTVDAFLKKYAAYKPGGANALSLGDFGSSIFSDFDEKKTVDRQSAANAYRELIKKLADQTEEALMITMGNANAIDYADFVVQAPMGCSGYLAEDREVPFFQLVYHGLISYAGEALNTTSSYRRDLLKAVEYGSCPYYLWTWETSSEAKDSGFSFLYSTEFSQWAEDAAKYYQRANEALGPLQGLRMVGNRTLEGGVKETAYEDGTRILVNYGPRDAAAAGVTVPAEDFVVMKGAE